jgi:small subunit ribosomal protein S8
MNNQDPIADMLTRIRNANRTGRKTVNVLNSKICRGIAQVLLDEGYIDGFDVVEDGRQGVIRIRLRYALDGDKVIHEIVRISKPGRRIYKPVEALPNVMNGLGIAVVSTSKGVMSDRRAREANVGGELLCVVN